MDKFEKIISACFEKGFSDLHIVGDHPLVCRKDGRIYFQKEFSFTPEYIDDLAAKLLNPRQLKRLRNRWSVDLGVSVCQNRLRLNIFNTVRGLSMAIRFLPGKTPSIENLNLHPGIADICRADFGLALVCGPTGSGKTTTIASMINEINTTRQAHVITLEDPIEYVFRSKKAFVEQRELGRHFHTYRDGLLDVLREAPDVIVVGEMRRPDTIRLSLDAAESGHLVISTMHAGTPQEAVYRICNSFPFESQEFVRHQLSACLSHIIIQQLKFMPKLGFSAPVLCMMEKNKALANMIRENKLGQLENAIETSQEPGVMSSRRYMEEFINRKKRFSIPSKALYPSDSRIEFPREHHSRLIDANADFTVSDAQAAASPNAYDADEAFTYGPGKATPGPQNDAVDDYIARLQAGEQALDPPAPATAPRPKPRNAKRDS